MPRIALNLTDQHFGKLTAKWTVPAPAGSSPASMKAKWWFCECACGGTKIVRASSLSSGLTTSCGCALKEMGVSRRKDISGQRFGRLVAKRRAGKSPHGQELWECICDCENVVEVPLCSLTTGLTQSCGCLQKEKARVSALITGPANLKKHIEDYRVSRGGEPEIPLLPTGKLERARAARKMKRMREDLEVCDLCGEPAVEMHHITPMKDGGKADCDLNLAPLCYKCHRRKAHLNGNLKGPVCPIVEALLRKKAIDRVNEKRS